MKIFLMRSLRSSLLAFVCSGILFTHADARPIVVELYTSQGCPNCPEADAILKKISANTTYLPLSLHVTYFDKRGWKDPFSSVTNTERQSRFEKHFGMDSLFTPQMVVDGKYSVVGSNPNDVAAALKKAKSSRKEIPVTIALNSSRNDLEVTLGDSHTPVPANITVYEVHFNRSAITPVSSGDNDGLTLENVNNVVAFLPIAPAQRYQLPLSSFTEDGIAFLLEDTNLEIIGAAYYVRK